jgi:signal transduction histidine kinase
VDLGRSVATVRPSADVSLRVVALPWTWADRSGVVAAAQSTDVLDAQIRSLDGFLIVAGIVTIIAVGLVSWLVIGRALRPLRSLSSTADAIARTGDLRQRLPGPRTRDEVGTLTRSFNAMLDRLEASQTALEGSLAAQRRMVADASHELRTPLTTIRTNAEALRAHPDADPAEREAAVRDIADEAERMSRLLDDLLLLARADAGDMTVVSRRPVDLAVIAADVARKADRPDRPVRLVRSGPLVVEGDPDALTRLVWNLVDNAQRHGLGEVELTTGADSTGGWLAVSDRGHGFAPGDEVRAFDRFWRADRARSGPGAGLGLAIARSIADAHGGTIDAANREGGGAVLTVRLPGAWARAPGVAPA